MGFAPNTGYAGTELYLRNNRCRMEFEAARDRTKDPLKQYRDTAIPDPTITENVVAELASFLVTDHDKLLLRSMGSQLSNKLARHCVDGIGSPYAARHTTLQRIKHHKRQNARLGPLLSKYPDLADAVKALSELGIPIARPERWRAAEGGSPQAVTREALARLIDLHFDESDLLEPARQVLHCLEHLSSALGEPLFIGQSKDC